MAGLRLDDLSVEGVCTSWSLTVPVGTVRAAVVRDQESVRDLLEVVLGLVAPTGGRVLVDDVNALEQPDDHHRRRRHRAGNDDQCRVRYVPASGGLEPGLTLQQNLTRASCPTVRVSRRRAAAQARDTATRLGLRRLLGRYPEQLTVGQRQLAGFAMALCWRPCALVVEDSPDLPTWDAALEFERLRLDPAAVPGPRGLFAEVAGLVLTTDPARTRLLDPDPVGVQPASVAGLGDRRGDHDRNDDDGDDDRGDGDGEPSGRAGERVGGTSRDTGRGSRHA
ncbi:ATP-binding cassette domain-containing protein [Actinopolymorpha singaporensis]|uniref:ABC transporter n=1 Tax=Actinopolymorpha singaporensis TaxID=117157 RepID=A0A1H1XC17_9ACTN|nr:ATP-binding cassette domain-containing protein [Actinopolymorpha singaporensis]SDT06854.1 ABC transporter [Actinopolymorpha singaporensis]